MGTVINQFTDKFNEFRSLGAGEAFTIRVTDTEATQAAEEYLSEYESDVKDMIRKASGMSLDVSDPMIRFYPDEVAVSARGGKGFMKFRASLRADVSWTGDLNVHVTSVEVPVVKITPEKLNSLVRDPLSKGMLIVREYAEIQSFRILNGEAVLEGVRK